MYITIAYVKCTWCFTWVNNVEYSKIWNSKLTIKPVKELLQVDASLIVIFLVIITVLLAALFLNTTAKGGNII